MLVAAASRAATVTAANDYPSTLETSAGADHSVVFTTPSGAAEGDTITIAFDSEFGSASITEDDVDVEDDGVDLTTAADCSGAEQASVAMSADTLTITLCPLDGGAIAGGSEVSVRVGTNATGSGIGANQITNPAGAGTYFLNLAGTFGDSGSIALPMLDAGSVTVSAEVGTGGGGGGGGGGGCADTTAPTISSIVVSGVTSDSATVSWTTSENASSEVDYGTAESYELGSESSTSLVTSHSLSLSSLSEGTEYHFRVRSSDLCANQATSADQTFTTSDAAGPVISDIDVSLSCDTSATVTWTTDESATSEIAYGTSVSYGSTASDADLLTAHELVLSGLTRDASYHVAVSSTDGSGNESTSADQTFTTDEDAAPSNVSGFGASVGDGSATLSWTNPSADFDGVRVLQCTDAYPSDAADDDCVTVYDGTDESTAVSGLTNGTTYYFGAFSYDGCGQFASGALATGTPSAPEEEVPPEEEETPVVTPPEVGDGDTPTDPDDSGGGEETPPAEEEEVPPGEVPAGEESPEVETPDIPPTTVPEETLVPDRDVMFLVANVQIQLVPAGSGAVHLLSSRPLRISLLTDHIVQPVSRVQLILGESAYNMSLAGDGASYFADVSSPGVSGAYATAVSIFYADGTVQSISRSTDVEGDGFVFATTDGQTRRLGGATVTLLTNGTVPWDGSPFGQFNPFETGSDGAYGWYVPNTTYALSAERSGYTSSAIQTFSVADNIVNLAVPLEPIPSEEEVAPPSTPTEPVSTVIASVGETISDTIETIRDIPGVEEAAAVSTPALAIATAATATVLASSFSLFPFLQYLFTSPFLFFARRRRRAFGVVYNAISKVPLDLATVRLYRMPDDWEGDPSVVGRLVQSRVTDKGGRYFFLPAAGRYRIVASKNGLTFPSDYLAGEKDDGEFLDVYHGEPIQVNDETATIAVNIPLDPSQSAEVHAAPAVLRRKRLRRAQQAVAVLGILFAAFATIIQPTPLSFGMLALQTVLYLLVRRLAKPRATKAWGIVYDQETGRPLERAVVRVFEPKYNKLLETAVTDSKGRYTFLLGPNEYYTVYEKPGFEPVEVRPIDYRSRSEPSEFSADVRMSTESSVASSPPPEPAPPSAQL